MDYLAIISICSVLVMLFSAYVAYKSYLLQKNIRRPKLVHSKTPYEFQHYVKDDKFHLTQWRIVAEKIGGESATIKKILFKINYDSRSFLGKIIPEEITYTDVSSGAKFIVDLCPAINKHQDCWDLGKIPTSDNPNTVSVNSGQSITAIEPEEAAALMLMGDMQQMSYLASIFYKTKDAKDNTSPYVLIIGGKFKEN